MPIKLLVYPISTILPHEQLSGDTTLINPGYIFFLLVMTNTSCTFFRSVGTSTAAFALAILEGSTQPGVWFPEQVCVSSSQFYFILFLLSKMENRAFFC